MAVALTSLPNQRDIDLGSPLNVLLPGETADRRGDEIIGQVAGG